MAQTTGSATNCALKTLQSLENVANGVYPAIVRTETYNTAAALEDSSMVSGIKVDTTGNAKPTASSNKKVQVKYLKPDFTAADNSAHDWTCSDVSDSPENYGYDDTTVADFVADQFSITPTDYDDRTDSTIEEDIATKIWTVWRKMAKSYNDKLALKAMGKAGNYYANAADTPVSSLTNAVEIPLFSAETVTQPQPLALHKMVWQYERMGVGDRPVYVVGGNDLWSGYIYSRKIYAGNPDGRDSNLGFDPFGGTAYKDYQIDVIGDANTIISVSEQRVLSWVPDTFKIVDWYVFDNGVKRTDGQSQIGQIFNPVQNSVNIFRGKMDIGTAFSGRPFVCDVQIKYDECAGPGGKITWKFEKDFDLWAIPQGAFTVANNQHHNYVLLWTVGAANLTAAGLS